MMNNIKRRYQYEREEERKTNEEKKAIKNNMEKERENEGVMNNDGD